MSLILNTGAMKYRENSSDQWKPLVIKAGMNWESMAETYDPDEGTYEEGELVLEDGRMYRCTVTGGITTPEAWNPQHWTETSVADELESYIIISDDQPTQNTNKIWIEETTAPFGVDIPTMEDHNELKTSMNDVIGENPISVNGINTGATILAGTFFYNNGVLVYATKDIANNDSISGNNSANAAAEGAINVLACTYQDVQANFTNVAVGSYSNMPLSPPTGYTNPVLSRIIDRSSWGAGAVEIVQSSGNYLIGVRNLGTVTASFVGTIRILWFK